jgi:hypothetical protein
VAKNVRKGMCSDLVVERSSPKKCPESGTLPIYYEEWGGSAWLNFFKKSIRSVIGEIDIVCLKFQLAKRR